MKKIILSVVLILSIIPHSPANIQKIMQDTQRLKQLGSDWNMVWWVPTEFWTTSFKEDGSLTPKQVDDFVKIVDEYSIFIVSRMSSGAMGGMTFTSNEEVKSNTVFKVEGEIINPLSIDEMSMDAQNFFLMMKPMMTNMLGHFGGGMEFLAYPNKKDGKKIIDPMKKGNFQYTCFGETEKWRLPLGSLLPPMCDEKTDEEFPGNYIFNPFTGDKLEKKK